MTAELARCEDKQRRNQGARLMDQHQRDLAGGRVERFAPEPVTHEGCNQQWGRDASWVCSLVAVTLVCAGLWQARAEREARRVAEFEQERLATVWSTQSNWAYPAPTLRKGPKVGKTPGWIASGAGSKDANGTYEPTETRGTYLNENGWKLIDVAGTWVIYDPALIMRYHGTGKLPANPWKLSMGTLPPPLQAGPPPV